MYSCFYLVSPKELYKSDLQMCVCVCMCAANSAPVRVCAWVAKVQIDAKINYEHVVRIGMRLTWCEPVTWPCWAAVLRLWCRWTINPHPHVWHRADKASAWSVTGRQRRIAVTMKTETPPPQERENNLYCEHAICPVVHFNTLWHCCAVWNCHVSQFVHLREAPDCISQSSMNKIKFATQLFL